MDRYKKNTTLTVSGNEGKMSIENRGEHGGIYHEDKLEANRMGPMLEKNKIFIGGINYQTTEETILREFGVFGLIINTRIIRDQVTGKNKGYAFVTYAEEKSAEKAVVGMHDKEFDGRVIGVKIAFDKRSKAL